MRRLRTIARTLSLGALFTFGLGCAGAMNSAMQLAGVDFEMKLGADAVHPPDFPAMPLMVGEKKMSMRLTAPGDSINFPDDVPMPDDMPLDASTKYDIELVIYSVPSADRPEAVAQAILQVQTAGFKAVDEPPKAEDDVKEIDVSTYDQTIFVTIGTDDGSESAVAFVRMKPAPEDPTDEAPAEEPAPEAPPAE